MVLFIIGLRVQQSVQLCGVADLNLGDPGIALGALIDSLSLIVKEGVALHDRSGHRRQNVRGRLDRFHSSDRLTSSDFQARLGELDEDDIAKRLSSVRGNSNLGCI